MIAEIDKVLGAACEYEKRSKDVHCPYDMRIRFAQKADQLFEHAIRLDNNKSIFEKEHK